MRMVTDMMLSIESPNYIDDKGRTAAEMNALLTDDRIEHMKQIFAEAILKVIDDAEKLDIYSFNISFKEDIVIPDSIKNKKEVTE